MRRAKTILLTTLVAASCRGSAPTVSAHDQADQILPFEAPEGLTGPISRRLYDAVGMTDIEQPIGLDAAHAPYADGYWPYYRGGIDVQWNGMQASPLQKYIALTSPNDAAAAKAWEATNHGPSLPNVDTWWGHCPGWVASSLVNAPLGHAVDATFGASGFTACTAGAAGCTHFEIGDINALEAEVWNDAASVFVGARCDTKPSAIQRDANGRVLKEGCDGVNAGSLLLIASTLSRRHVPFAIEAQNDSNTDQIWNQPAYQFVLHRLKPLTMQEAIALVSPSATPTASAGVYPWDSAAQGFALVDFSISWVSESGPNIVPISGASSTRDLRVVAVLELSAAATDPATTVLGGEFIDDPTVGATRLQVSPYVWLATAPGPESVPVTDDGGHHNPYVKSSHVQQLVKLGQ